MIKYVLVDLDGTLVNSCEGVTKSIKYALESMNINCPDLNALKKYIGPPITWSFADAGVPEAKVNDAIKKYRERYEVTGLFEAEVYTGIPELLQALHDSGKKLILATSKPINYAVKVMEHFKLDTYFDDLCGAGSDTERNTKADVVRYIIEKHDISDLSEALMLGDTKFDVLGARECGIKTLGVLWGFGDTESLMNAGAIGVVKTPEEAYEKIVQMN